MEGGGRDINDLHRLIAEFESLAGPSSDPPPFPSLGLESQSITPRSTEEQDADYSFLSTPAPPKQQQQAGAFDMLNLDFSDLTIRKNRALEKEIRSYEAPKPQRALFNEEVVGVSSIIFN